MKNIVVFASGRGSNFKSILDKVEAGEIPANIVCVVSDKSHPPVFEKAAIADISTYFIHPKHFDSQEKYAEILNGFLENYETDLIVLAGYLKLIPEKVVKNFRNQIINIHPALLPKYGGKGFYGSKVHEAVIESGDKESGATVHFVDESYDTGPIILQEKVPVKSGDTPDELSDRVLEVEHKIFPKVVKAICEDRITINKSGVKLKDE